MNRIACNSLLQCGRGRGGARGGGACKGTVGNPARAGALDYALGLPCRRSGLAVRGARSKYKNTNGF